MLAGKDKDKEPPIKLSPEQLERYQGQLALPGMSESAQIRLLKAKVVILGLEGGSIAAACQLAAAGIGKLVLVDRQRIRLKDLSSQSIFLPGDIGQTKISTLKTRLEELNADVTVEPSERSFNAHNAEELLGTCQIVIDGLAGWQDKLLLSDVCMDMDKPLVHAGLMPFSFQIFTMIPGRSACLRCVFSRIGLEDLPPESHLQGGFGPLSAMAGSFQAMETIKLLTGVGTTPGNHLIRFDCLRRDFDGVLDLGPRPDCPDCGRRF